MATTSSHVTVIRFALFLDELSYTLPEGADLDAIALQVGNAMRDGKVVKVDIEQLNGDVVGAFVNPSRARIAYVAPRDINVGTPGHA
jgi:hypothetical protein